MRVFLHSHRQIWFYEARKVVTTTFSCCPNFQTILFPVYQTCRLFWFLVSREDILVSLGKNSRCKLPISANLHVDIEEVVLSAFSFDLVWVLLPKLLVPVQFPFVLEFLVCWGIPFATVIHYTLGDGGIEGNVLSWLIIFFTSSRFCAWNTVNERSDYTMVDDRREYIYEITIWSYESK